MGVIEFNYLVNFIFTWQKVERGKNKCVEKLAPHTFSDLQIKIKLTK